MRLFGYKCVTNLWDEFTKAERSGIPAIRATYNRVMRERSNDVVYLTELVMVLNHKISQWYDGDNSDNGLHTEIARAYSDLWVKTAEYAGTHLEGEDLAYYYNMMDKGV